MGELLECGQCGQCYKPWGNLSDLCQECEAEAAELAQEYERERRIDNALACKCGAWGFTPSGQPYHAADCVCGHT